MEINDDVSQHEKLLGLNEKKIVIELERSYASIEFTNYWEVHLLRLLIIFCHTVPPVIRRLVLTSSLFKVCFDKNKNTPTAKICQTKRVFAIQLFTVDRYA